MGDAPYAEQAAREMLLPCPFCGSAAECHPDEIGSGGQHVPPYYAGCRSCRVNFMAEESVDAIAAWNRRTLATLSDIPADERENVRFAVECAIAGKVAAPLFQIEKDALRRFLPRLGPTQPARGGG